MLEVFLDALLDSVKILPIIFLVYVLIEYLESREASKHILGKAFSSRFSPLFGALIGIVPQCGFSVVATKLYQGGFIYLGTLLAVYFATSDEAVPILLSRAITEPSIWADLGLLVLIKVGYAILVGFVINFIMKKFFKVSTAYASAGFAEEDFEGDKDGCCHHEVSSERKSFWQMLYHPLIHSLKIIAYIFIINMVLGVLIEIVIGIENFEAFLLSSKYLQPLVATAVGLIPNCASSVILTDLYADGMLCFGAALAGLTANSGLGLAILLKNGKDIKKNAIVVGLCFILPLILGYSFIFI